MLSIIVLVVSLVVAYNIKFKHVTERGTKKINVNLGALDKIFVWFVSIFNPILAGLLTDSAKLLQVTEHGFNKSSVSLSRQEKVIVWILSILNPVIAGAVFYYVWKKLLPNKARTAIFISMWVFLVYIIIWFASGSYQQYFRF